MLRRHLLLSASALLASGVTTLHGALSGQRLGLVIHSYSNRWRGRYSSVKQPPFRDVLDVMDHGQELGLGSLQIGLEDWTLDLARKARGSSESYDMKLEGSIRLPQAEGDVERFTREIRLGKEAGMTIFRTALGGRRYEQFTRLDDFEHWKSHAQRSLELAEPVARRLGVKIAVENHKDFEVQELVDLMKAMSSEQVGICLDTGNSLALLESPMTVVKALAPYTLTVHLKDIAVRAVDDGFEMAEVPLGKGILDLVEMLRVIRQAASAAEFHLEMITRDPLIIPCLHESYWATFPKKPGSDLARTLSLVKTRGAAALTHVAALPLEAKLALEEKQVTDSLFAAGDTFGFSQTQIKAAQKADKR